MYKMFALCEQTHTFVKPNAAVPANKLAWSSPAAAPGVCVCVISVSVFLPSPRPSCQDGVSRGSIVIS